MLNHSKTEFITFSKKSNPEETKRNNLLIGNYKIPNANCVKLLGIYLDRTLNFQEELKHVLRTMATGIKTLKRISRLFPEQTRLLLLNALVMSFTRLRPFTGQLQKQLLYYFGETIKLGCKDVLQSQKIRQFFWSKTKTSNSAKNIFLGKQSTKLFYETYQ